MSAPTYMQFPTAVPSKILNGGASNVRAPVVLSVHVPTSRLSFASTMTPLLIYNPSPIANLAGSPTEPN